MTDIYNMEFPEDEINEMNLLPKGTFRSKVVKINQGETQKGYLSIRVDFEVMEPVEWAGFVYNENFVVGSESKPNQVDPDAWGSKFFKSTYKAAQVPGGKNLGMILSGLMGAQLDVRIDCIEDDFGTKNKTQGRYQAGTKEVGIDPNQPDCSPLSTAGGSPTGPPPAMPPAQTNVPPPPMPQMQQPPSVNQTVYQPPQPPQPPPPPQMNYTPPQTGATMPPPPPPPPQAAQQPQAGHMVCPICMRFTGDKNAMTEHMRTCNG